MSRWILASASPRRRELLEQVGFSFEILPSACEEKVTAKNPAAVVEELSRQKAEEVFARVADPASGQETEEELTVVGADTVVAADGCILGKPRDEEEACRMLRQLQGRSHQVYTGVTLCVLRQGKKSVKTFHECTEVTFYPLEEARIKSYVETGEPMDKAGAYGIQGRGALFVERIAGDYNNVVGLPVARLFREMAITGGQEQA